MITTTQFAMSNDVNFWKQEAESYKKKFRDLQEEFEEFRQGSSELEKELESHIKILERNNAELKLNNAKLFTESQSYKRKFEQLSAQYNQEIGEINNDLLQTKGAKESLQNYIRELEQSNDDLERAKRAAIVSLEDFEARLNHAIERNAFLESELDEKEQLSETVQRLKDKTKELKMELDIRTHIKQPQQIISQNNLHSTPTHSSSPLDFDLFGVDKKPMQLMDIVESDQESSQRMNEESPYLLNSSIPISPITTPPNMISINASTTTDRLLRLKESQRHKNHQYQQHHRSSHHNNNNNYNNTNHQNNKEQIIFDQSLLTNMSSPSDTSLSRLTPSSRINALNVVTDLIKKVGALENKLASCRNFTNNFTKFNHSERKKLTGTPNTNGHQNNEILLVNGNIDNSSPI